MVLPADEQNETIRSGLRCLAKFLNFALIFFDFKELHFKSVEMESDSETSLPRCAIYRLSSKATGRCSESPSMAIHSAWWWPL